MLPVRARIPISTGSPGPTQAQDPAQLAKAKIVSQIDHAPAMQPYPGWNVYLNDLIIPPEQITPGSVYQISSERSRPERGSSFSVSPVVAILVNTLGNVIVTSETDRSYTQMFFGATVDARGTAVLPTPPQVTDFGATESPRPTEGSYYYATSRSAPSITHVTTPALITGVNPLPEAGKAYTLYKTVYRTTITPVTIFVRTENKQLEVDLGCSSSTVYHATTTSSPGIVYVSRQSYEPLLIEDGKVNVRLLVATSLLPLRNNYYIAGPNAPIETLSGRVLYTSAIYDFVCSPRIVVNSTQQLFVVNTQPISTTRLAFANAIVFNTNIVVNSTQQLFVVNTQPILYTSAIYDFVCSPRIVVNSTQQLFVVNTQPISTTRLAFANAIVFNTNIVAGPNAPIETLSGRISTTRLAFANAIVFSTNIVVSQSSYLPNIGNNFSSKASVFSAAFTKSVLAVAEFVPPRLGSVNSLRGVHSDRTNAVAGIYLAVGLDRLPQTGLVVYTSNLYTPNQLSSYQSKTFANTEFVYTIYKTEILTSKSYIAIGQQLAKSTLTLISSEVKLEDGRVLNYHSVANTVSPSKLTVTVQEFRASYNSTLTSKLIALSIVPSIQNLITKSEFLAISNSAVVKSVGFGNANAAIPSKTYSIKQLERVDSPGGSYSWHYPTINYSLLPTPVRIINQTNRVWLHEGQGFVWQIYQASLAQQLPQGVSLLAIAESPRPQDGLTITRISTAALPPTMLTSGPLFISAAMSYQNGAVAAQVICV